MFDTPISATTVWVGAKLAIFLAIDRYFLHLGWIGSFVGSKRCTKYFETNKKARLSSSSLFLPGLPSLWAGWICIISGAGLLLGGASDAFLHVYMTGPNLFTSAGISQDAAAFLLVLTAVSMIRQNVSGIKHQRNVPLAKPKFFREMNFWTNSFLMAQLYILGAGSLDEIRSIFQSIVSWVRQSQCHNNNTFLSLIITSGCVQYRKRGI